MKASFSRDQLQRAVQTAAAIAASRSPKDILRNLKLEVHPERARITATDLEIALRIDLPEVDVEQAGEILVPADRFGAIVRESTDERLSIESDEKSTRIVGDRSRFRLTTADPAEYPSIPELMGEGTTELSGKLLRELIRRTVFATDTESSRFALGGVLFEAEPERLTAVATDGRRLAKMEGPARTEPSAVETDAMTIVPSRCLQLIDRALRDREDDVQIASQGNSFFVVGTDFMISSRLVEGRFPRWRDVLPKRDEAVEVELTVGPLQAAVRQAAIVAHQESHGIDFKFGQGMLVLQALSPQAGESRVELPIGYEGPEVVLRLDHTFVSDFLRVLNPETSFTLNIENADSAALFETDDRYLYVVMPLARESAPTAAADTASV